MPKSYRATITGNTIKWLDKVPPAVLKGKPVKVIVTILGTVPANPKRSFGLEKGGFAITDDFDSSLPNEMHKDFEN